jgi:uncharacterized protein YciI
MHPSCFPLSSTPSLTPSSLAAAIATILILALGGCVTHDDHTPDSHLTLTTPYTLTYLKSGPRSGQGRDGTAEEQALRDRMFAGHMANIRRLADEGKLVIAGPFDHPTDQAWRGLLILDVPTEIQADALAATDPAVQAGEFIAESHAMLSSTVLRRTMEFDRAMQAELKSAPPNPGAQPPTIRLYVMITAEDFTRADRAILASAWRDKVIWKGRFTDTPRGVFVLDATAPDEVRAGLIDTGPASIDGWRSTTALARLRDAATARDQ